MASTATSPATLSITVRSIADAVPRPRRLATVAPEKVRDLVADWLYRNVMVRYDFVWEVCDQARYQIRHNNLEQYRCGSAATTFKTLMEELSPESPADDGPTLIDEFAGWLLRGLLAFGQDPQSMYRAIDAACGRAHRIKEAKGGYR
jgi:hypothetical protein